MTATALLATLLAAAACGDGGDVKIVALTRTPTPETGSGDPTPIPPPTSITATATVTAAAELPLRPTNPLAGGLAVAGYLAGGQANIAGCLPELVAAWQLEPIVGKRCLFADIDGDGEGELAFVITVGSSGGTASGDVWFFQGADESFRLFSSARVLANRVLEDIVLEATTDLTGDRFPDLVISARSCDADICTTRFIIASAHRGRIEDLAPDNLAVSGLKSVTVEDTTGDGITDLIISGVGTMPTPGAGPPRASELVLNWGGLIFFKRERSDEPRYLFHAIVDADEAFSAAEYEKARRLYEAAVVDTSLVDWRVEQGLGSGRSELVSYALFRAALSALRSDDNAGVIDNLDQAISGYSGALHGQVAAIYREALQAQVPPNLVCAAVESFLQPQESHYAQIWDYGFANPEHAISDLCR